MNHTILLKALDQFQVMSLLHDNKQNRAITCMNCAKAPGNSELRRNNPWEDGSTLVFSDDRRRLEQRLKTAVTCAGMTMGMEENGCSGQQQEWRRESRSGVPQQQQLD
jgi:hypothetical protein